MTTETMNVHQALAELKMMDKRIQAATREPEWATTNKHSNTKLRLANGFVVGSICKAER